MTHTLEQIKKQVLGRQINLVSQVERGHLDRDARTCDIAITSDKPIEHWFGRIILNHSASSIRMDRIKSNAPALLEHDRRQKIGGLSNVRTDGNVLRATVKFSRCPEADREMNDIEDGIPRSISGGFILHELHFLSEDDNGNRTYQSDDWEPLEASFVTIPADISVGVGRSLEPVEPPVEPIPAIIENPPTVEPVEPQQTRALDSTPRVESVIERSQPLMDKEALLKLGEMFGQRALAEDYILSNSDANEEGLKAIIREKRAAEQTTIVKPAPRVDFTEKDAKRYSIARALKLACGIDVEKCGFEQEVSNEIQRNMESGIEYRGGVMVPTGLEKAMLKRAGLDTLTVGAGQDTVFTDYGGLIEYLYARAKVLQLGATIKAGLRGNLKLTKQTGSATANWVAENPGVNAPESNLSTGFVTLSPKSLIATTSFSRQLLNQSEWNIQSEVERDLGMAMALAVDKAAIHGSGAANQPQGLYLQSGVNVVAFGGPMTKDKLVDMETAIAEANADIGDYAYLTTPGAVGKGAKTLEFAAAGAKALFSGGQLNGRKVEQSTQVSKLMLNSAATGGTSHGILFGVWPQLYVGEWGAMELIVDPFALKKQAMIEVTSFLMADIQLRHPEAFTKGTGQSV